MTRITSGKKDRRSSIGHIRREILVTLVLLSCLYNSSQRNNDTETAASAPPQPGDPEEKKNPFGKRTIEPILLKSLAKVRGPGGNPDGKDPGYKEWDVDPDSILQSSRSQDLQCHWHDFQSSTGQTGIMCCHDDDDLVTRRIKTKKRWRECDILSKLWKESKVKTPNSIYLEIGANIGSCVMEMLLSTDAKIVAFEPHPYNQWMLQNSIENLDPSYQSRFVLVPVGLGKETSANKIYASPRNMGNSVVGTVVKDFGGQSVESFVEHDIFIEPISAILDANAGIDIPLVKLDAQGFECQILAGMDPSLARLINTIKAEAAPKWLRGQHCLNFFGGLRELGFTVREEGGKMEITKEAHEFSRLFEIIASKND